MTSWSKEAATATTSIKTVNLLHYAFSEMWRLSMQTFSERDSALKYPSVCILKVFFPRVRKETCSGLEIARNPPNSHVFSCRADSVTDSRFPRWSYCVFISPLTSFSSTKPYTRLNSTRLEFPDFVPFSFHVLLWFALHLYHMALNFSSGFERCYRNKSSFLLLFCWTIACTPQRPLGGFCMICSRMSVSAQSWTVPCWPLDSVPRRIMTHELLYFHSILKCPCCCAPFGAQLRLKKPCT